MMFGLSGIVISINPSFNAIQFLKVVLDNDDLQD